MLLASIIIRVKQKQSHILQLCSMFIITDKNVQNVQFFNFFVVRDLPLLPLYQTNACKTCKFINSSNELRRQILTLMSMPYQNKRFESTRLQSKIKSSFGVTGSPSFSALTPPSLSFHSKHQQKAHQKKRTADPNCPMPPQSCKNTAKTGTKGKQQDYKKVNSRFS